MFINVAYKDEPELSHFRRQSCISDEVEPDPSVEKTLLVNPNCPVRVMLEYIRKRCKLGIFSQFDLSDETGRLMGLFMLPTYDYATEQFEHKRTYYVIVLKYETDKRVSVLPQLNHENAFYQELKNRVKRFIVTGDTSPLTTSPVGKVTPPGKATPSSNKTVAKKK